MTSQPPEQLLLSDLSQVVDFVAQELRSETEVTSIANLSDIFDQPIPSNARSRERWTPVFDAALEGSPETLPKLLKNIRYSLGEGRGAKLDKALQRVREFCVSRVTRTAHPELNDQADDLITASSVEQMLEAAKNLRSTALSVRRLLMRPLVGDTFLQLEKSLGASYPEPEWLRMQLADQAVNVVTAVDYLLTLLYTPTTTSAQLVLGAEADSDRAQGRSDEEALDWLTRRRLDARATAVRQSQRLLVALRRDIA